MMRGAGSGVPASARARGRQPSVVGLGSIGTTILTFLSCLGSVYVGGRLWQDAKLGRELVEARRQLQTKVSSKALSVEESMMKIELGELQKREAILQVELAEAKAMGFIPMTASARRPPLGTLAWARGTGRAGNRSASSTGVASGPTAKGGSDLEPTKFLAVIGINTRFADRPLRDAIRSTWLPSTGGTLKSIEEQQGLVFRFVVGHSPNRGDSSDRAIAEENTAHGDFLILDDHEEDDHDMARKLKSFYAKAVRTWDAAFYAKMDDNVYVNIPGLVSVLKEYVPRARLYLGCMKSTEVVVDSNSRWYEPEWSKFGDGKMYMRHAAGPFHVVTREVALLLAVTRSLLHEFKHEDVSLGAWMLGLDVKYVDERRLCCASAPEDECAKKREAGKPCAAVYDWHCGGLCEAEKRLAQVHRQCWGGQGTGGSLRA